VKEGDRIAVHTPMIPKAVVAMLVVRLGALHSVVAGFSAEAFSSRILNSNCHYVVASTYRNSSFSAT
jgi:acyl-coenzyme A synthetase/AMP-(fatty) acid ligase